jgi:uncharacterized protein DUF6455
MIRSRKSKSMPTVLDQTSPQHARNMTVMTERLGLAMVPAAWPTGVSHLAQAIDACQRCDTAVVCTDWLRNAPTAIELPPAFCPDTETFTAAKRAKKRD